MHLALVTKKNKPSVLLKKRRPSTVASIYGHWPTKKFVAPRGWLIWVGGTPKSTKIAPSNVYWEKMNFEAPNRDGNIQRGYYPRSLAH